MVAAGTLTKEDRQFIQSVIKRESLACDSSLQSDIPSLQEDPSSNPSEQISLQPDNMPTSDPPTISLPTNLAFVHIPDETLLTPEMQDDTDESIAETTAFLKSLQEEEKRVLEEMEKLQAEDNERLKRERAEREKRIEEIRRENGLLPNEEEEAWEEEEEEDCRRRTVFMNSLRTELATMLTSLKTEKGKREPKAQVKQIEKTIREKMKEDEKNRKETQLERDRKQREKRENVMKTLSYAEKKELERKEKLRKDRKAYAEQIRKEEEEKERRERERRKKNEEERKKRLLEYNRQKEEEKRKNAEKKKQWCEEKKRLEEEEKWKRERELRKRKPVVTRCPGSPHSPVHSMKCSFLCWYKASGANLQQQGRILRRPPGFQLQPIPPD